MRRTLVGRWVSSRVEMPAFESAADKPGASKESLKPSPVNLIW
jgi:hypothetical protein